MKLCNLVGLFVLLCSLSSPANVVKHCSFDAPPQAGGISVVGRRGKGISIKAGKTGIFPLDTEYGLKTGTLEFWLSRKHWDVAANKPVAVIELQNNEKTVLTLQKNADNPFLILNVNGKALAQIPIYDWYPQAWLKKKANQIHQWQLVTVTWDDGKYILYLNGSQGEPIATGVGPVKLAFDRIVLGSPTNTQTLDLDELKIISQTVPNDKIEEHYKSLYSDAYNYLKPRFTAAYTTVKPVLDGQLTDKVWENATCFIGLNKLGTWRLQKEVKVYCAYDKDTLYFGFKVPYKGALKGSKPPLERDFHQEYADNIEVFLDPSMGLEESYYQLAGNCFGSINDYMGMSKSWNGNWSWKTHVGREHWTAEMAVPFAVFNKTYPHDGSSWGVNICGATPWMNWAAAKLFHDRKSFGMLLFDRSYPVIQMGQLALQKAGELKFGFNILNPISKPQSLNIVLQVIPTGATEVKQTKELKDFPLEPGTSSNVNLDLKVKDTPKGTAVLSVQLADGKLVSYQRFEYDHSPKPVASPQKPVATKKVSKQVVQKVKEPTIERIKKLSDKTLAKTVLLREKWQNNTIGITHKVYPPWTPVTINEEKFGVWGRNYNYNNSLLPAEIFSLDSSLLDGPISLTWGYMDQFSKLDGSSSPVSIIDKNDDAITFKTNFHNDTLSLECRQTLEFDGMLKVDLDIEPTADHKMIDRLQLEIPLNPRYAKYYHVIGGENQPPVTDVGKIPEKGISFPFKNMIWTGTEKIGLCWFAEDQQNWNCAPNTDIIRIVRKNGITVLRIDIINKSLKLIKKRTITFGLMATPVRKREETWRQWHIDNRGGDGQKGAMGWLWFWGPESYTLRPDYEQLAQTIKRHSRKNRVLFMASSLNYCRSFNMDCGKYFKKPRAVDGLINPEYKLWGKEWLITGFYPPRPGIFSEHNTLDVKGGLFKACSASSFQDYYVYMLKEMIEKSGVNTIYLDQAMKLCGNAIHGCGYHDTNGYWQPRIPIFAYREMLKRIRNVFYEKYGFTRIMLHCSNQIMVPVISFTDIFLDGETYNCGPSKVYDHYSKVIPLTRYRIQHSLKAFGPVPYFLPELTKDGGGLKLEYTRELIGYNLLHDSYTMPFPRGVSDAMKHVQAIWRQFCGQPGIKCYPYWDNKWLKAEPAEFKATAWIKDKNMMIVVVNTSPDRMLSGHLVLNDVPSFKDIKSLTVTDAGSGKRIQSEGNKIFISVKNLDFRLIKVEWQ